jgi:hypothetical protein
LFQNQPQKTSILQIYNIIKNNYGEQHFELLYETNVKDDICYINYFSSNSILSVGTNTGNILFYKIYINETSDITKELVEQMCIIKTNKKRIVGVAINFVKGYVYSFANDHNIIISEMNYQSIMRTVPISKRDFSCMFYDERKLRCFATDEGGSIWIIDIYDSVRLSLLSYNLKLYKLFILICHSLLLWK